MSLLALENILDVPGTVEHTDNLNSVGDRSVENDVAAKGKTLNSRSQFLSLAPRARLVGEQLNRLSSRRVCR
jgi:hypothetical protein